MICQISVNPDCRVIPRCSRPISSLARDYWRCSSFPTRGGWPFIWAWAGHSVYRQTSISSVMNASDLFVVPGVSLQSEHLSWLLPAANYGRMSTWLEMEADEVYMSSYWRPSHISTIMSSWHVLLQQGDDAKWSYFSLSLLPNSESQGLAYTISEITIVQFNK